jgi:hypothetical protein
MIMAEELLSHARGKALIGDTGYDSNRFRQAVRDRKMRAFLAITQLACTWLWCDDILSSGYRLRPKRGVHAENSMGRGLLVAPRGG